MTVQGLLAQLGWVEMPKPELSGALALEDLLTGRGIDYLVEVDTYTGGVIFRGTRAGAFFYVAEEAAPAVRAMLGENGFQVFAEGT